MNPTAQGTRFMSPVSQHNGEKGHSTGSEHGGQGPAQEARNQENVAAGPSTSAGPEDAPPATRRPNKRPSNPWLGDNNAANTKNAPLTTAMAAAMEPSIIYARPYPPMALATPKKHANAIMTESRSVSK